MFSTISKEDQCLSIQAVSYGNREQDIAMSQLFGGFLGPEFWKLPRKLPLKRAGESFATYQLYYLLAHLNMFERVMGHSRSYINEEVIGGFLLAQKYTKT